MTKIKVNVNLAMEQAIVKTLKTVKLFDNPAKRFIIECDQGGFSAIEKRNGQYVYINMHSDGRVVHDRKLTEKEAKKLIQATLLDREESL